MLCLVVDATVKQLNLTVAVRWMENMKAYKQ